ncbi:MAG TPA: SDR family oxidoreductase [Terriglobales bacterium]|nr:SDR family oxidoreductase [Terriglobales bacterium]
MPTKRSAAARPELTGRLRGQVALITGGNRGIGLAIARALATEGCDVVVTGRDPAALQKASGELKSHGIRVLPVACDVRDPDSVAALISTVRKQFRRLDILINNAGVGHANLPVSRLPIDDWKKVIETNLTGMFLVTRAALPFLHAGATVVNNLSIAATRVFPGSSAYNASKHGAFGFTNTLREELRPKKIRVIALMPGATDTDIWQSLWPDAPRHKMMEPATVAAALISALVLPENSTVEELTLMPTAGTL